MKSDISKNGGIRTSNNFPLMRKLANSLRISFLITLETYKKACSNLGNIYSKKKKKSLNLGKNRALWHFYLP